MPWHFMPLIINANKDSTLTIHCQDKNPDELSKSQLILTKCVKDRGYLTTDFMGKRDLAPLLVLSLTLEPFPKLLTLPVFWGLDPNAHMDF